MTGLKVGGFSRSNTEQDSEDLYVAHRLCQ